MIRRVCIIGAGIGGLAAAMVLAGRGVQVDVVEQAPTVGGKALHVPAAHGITLRPVFDALFTAVAAAPPPMTRQTLLMRHRWADGTSLDIVDGVAANADAVGYFHGAAAARGYREFAARGQRYFEALEQPFINAQRPGALQFAAQPQLARQLGLGALAPLWDALGAHFTDPRLRQVFARAACYVGASPLLAPATLMMIAHIEQQGVWCLDGGPTALVAAMRDAATAAGARLRLATRVTGLRIEGGRARGVLLGAEVLAADAVIANVDPARLVPAIAALPAAKRSFSAIAWRVRRRDDGPARQIFLPDDPTAEFTALHYRQRLADQPSLQLGGDTAMILAPARADTRPLAAQAIAAAGQAALALTHGSLEFDDAVTTTPQDFEREAPGSGGALYGQALHGWGASFARPGARTRLPGFYLCGGGCHPGAGLAMAALSGRLAAEAALA